MESTLQQARALLEKGTSVRETAAATGLKKSQVEKLRAEIGVERRIAGLPPLEGARTGRPGLVDLEVRVTRELADDIDARALAAGLDRKTYIMRALWPDVPVTD